VSGAEPEVAAWWWFGWEVEAHEKEKPTVRPQRKESGADCGVKFKFKSILLGGTAIQSLAFPMDGFIEVITEHVWIV
jgi:hypothetical protein